MKHLEGLERVRPYQTPLSAYPHAFAAGQLRIPVCTCIFRNWSGIKKKSRPFQAAFFSGGRHA